MFSKAFLNRQNFWKNSIKTFSLTTVSDTPCPRGNNGEEWEKYKLKSREQTSLDRVDDTYANRANVYR